MDEIWTTSAPSLARKISRNASGHAHAKQCGDRRHPVHAGDPRIAWRARAAEALRENFLARLGADVVHISSIQEGFSDDGVTSIGVMGEQTPTGTMVQDLTPIALSDSILADPVVRAWYRDKLRHMRRARCILTISEASRQDAINFLGLPPANVINISAAAASCFRPSNMTAEERLALAASHGLARPFICYFGGFAPYKNVDRLLEAFALLPPQLRGRHRLVLIGQIASEERTRLEEVAARFGLTADDVCFFGLSEDSKLVDLLHACTLFVYPSLREGFGLPVLEAMAAGAATLCGDRSSLPEVIGRPDAMFDPSSAVAIAERMQTVLEDEGFRAALCAYGPERAKQFSWRRSARLALDVYESLHEEETARNRESRSVAVRLPRRPRLAWLADWPLPLGRAEDLLALGSSYEIELLLDSDVAAQRVVAAGLPVVDIANFPARLPAYDRVVIERADASDWLAIHPAVLFQRESEKSAPKTLAVSDSALGIIRDADTAFDEFQNRRAGPVRVQRAVRASRIADIVERGHCGASSSVALTRMLARCVPVNAGDEYDWALAEAVAANQPSPGSPRLLVDVSNQALGFPGSGIARVVSRILQSLMIAPPAGLTVEPVRSLTPGGSFHYARRYAASLSAHPDPDCEEEEVELRIGDQFLALDLNHFLPAQAAFIARLRELGGQAHALIHDLLPMQRPDWFPPGLNELHRRWFTEIAGWDRLLCVSQAVQAEVRTELDRHGRRDVWPKLGWFHLGSDLPNVSNAEPLPELAGRPSVLMVSILYARKGHMQALDAMERLWADGVDANLVFVGREGWGVNKLMRRLLTHPERGRRLFWYNGPDDALLSRLYATVDGVLIASEAEGFGLPLVEAIYHGRPVLARDLPVFRELVGDNVRYFRGLDAESLSGPLRQWLMELTAGHDLRQAGLTSPPGQLPPRGCCG